MKVLLIGAGAVGQVYGRHLQLGGAEVTFFVRDKYAEAMRAGLTMYELRMGRKRRRARFQDFNVVTTSEQVAAEPWDQVWICVSTTALFGDWLGPLLAGIGDATLVSLQPGLEVTDFLAERHPTERTVFGVIPFISYQAPLSTEGDLDPGMAYWLPPLTPTPLSGPEELVTPVVRALKAGGLSAKRHPNAGQWSAGPTAIMMPHLVGLENEGWDWWRFRASESLVTSVEASREALAVIDHHYGIDSFAKRVMRPWVMRTFLRIAPWVTPLDLPTYIAYHFTKVGGQTRFFMESYIQRAQKAGLPHAALARLLNKTM